MTRRAGLTLLELTISTAVGTILLLALGTFTASLVDGMGHATLELEVHQTGEIVTNSVEREVAAARILECVQAGADAPSITFVVPVDVGEDADGDLVLDTGEDENGSGSLDLTDGDYTDRNGLIQWGILEDSGPRLDTPGTEHRATLQFEAEADVFEGSIGFDVNRDGDFEDTFERGSIAFSTSGGRSYALGRGRVLLGKDDPSEDLDGDGAPDPLFTILGEAYTDGDGNGVYTSGESFTDSNGNGAWDGRLRLNLWVFGASGHQTPVCRNFTMAWEVQIDD